MPVAKGRCAISNSRGDSSSIGEFLDDAQSAGAVHCASFQQSDAAVHTPGLGFRFGGASDMPGAAAPGLGQDSRALLRELGLDDAAVDALCTVGVLTAPMA